MYSDIQRFVAAGRMMAKLAEEKARMAQTADEVIEAGPLLPTWKPGRFETGDVRTRHRQPWRCVQGHDSTGQANWGPGEAHSLWAPYHAKSEANALPWVQPYGAHDMYKEGEYMIWNDENVYRCKMDTVYSPAEYPQAWEAVTDD